VSVLIALSTHEELDKPFQDDVMERRDAPFAKSWLPTLKMIGAGIVATAIGVPMLVAGYSGANPLLLILGACATITGPIMLLALPFMGRGGYGQCPVCDTRIEALSGHAQDLLCGGCGAYLDVEENRLATIPHDRVHDAPKFAVPTPWPDIRGVVSSNVALSSSDYVSNVITDAIRKDKGAHVMDARWPDSCCVCAAPVARRECFALTVTMAGNIRDSKAELIVPDVPYCDRHRDGVDFADVAPDSRGAAHQYVLRFRSHAFREAFRRLNPWRWDGMIVKPSPEAVTPSKPESAPADAKVIIECPRCAQQMRVPTGRQGRIKCRACGEPFEAET
jgi:transcription elongation factor Elf1